MLKQVASFKQINDWVIIDSPPNASDMAAAVVTNCDVALIPCQPSPYDIWASSSIVELIKSVSSLGKRPKAAFVISRQIPNTKLTNEVRQAIEEFKLFTLTACMVQRVIYPQSAAKGKSVFELDENGPAAREMTAIAEEVQSYGR